MSNIFAYSNEVSTYSIGKGECMLDPESLIVPCSFDIYRTSGDVPEMEGEPIGECIGSVTGFLVLGHEIERRRPDEYMYCEMFMNLLCDDVTADLGCVVAALLKNGGPLMGDSIMTGIDHFYIDELNVDCPEMIPSILQDIPHIVFRQMHVFPELVSYYPRPLPHESRQDEQEKLLYDLADLTNSAILLLMSKGEYDADDPQCALTPAQIRMLRAVHENSTAYPKQYKDRKLWEPFLDAGFSEWGETRVLYCCIDR